MRKIIQIQTLVLNDDDEDEVCIYALCDDGSLWRRWDGGKWKRVDEIPQE